MLAGRPGPRGGGEWVGVSGGRPGTGAAGPGVPVPRPGRRHVRTTDVQRLAPKVAVPVHLGLLAPCRVLHPGPEATQWPLGTGTQRRMRQEVPAWGAQPVFGASQRQPKAPLPGHLPRTCTRGTRRAEILASGGGGARGKAAGGLRSAAPDRPPGRPAPPAGRPTPGLPFPRWPGRRPRVGAHPREAPPPHGPLPGPQGEDPGPERPCVLQPGRNLGWLPRLLGLPGLLGNRATPPRPRPLGPNGHPGQLLGPAGPRRGRLRRPGRDRGHPGGGLAAGFGLRSPLQAPESRCRPPQALAATAGNGRRRTSSGRLPLTALLLRKRPGP